MQAEIAKLTQYVEEFEATTRSMTNSVTALCNGWVSESTEAYREDYTKLANNFTNTQESADAFEETDIGYKEAVQNLEQGETD